jgi:hypothetical protein
LKTERIPSGKPWIWAAISGVIVIVGFAYLVKVPEPMLLPPRPTAPSVGLVDPVVIMGTMLRDPKPLFLPTDFNSSRRDYVPREPGGAFAGFTSKLTFSESELSLNLPPAAAVPASPAEALRGEPPGAPFLGFDRADPVMEPLSPRGAYVEIVEAGTGKTVFGRPVNDAHPPSSSVPWQPMEFIAAVDAVGLVGPVVPTTRSGISEVDAYFRRYLAETLGVGQRFPPGFYRIRVGP